MKKSYILITVIFVSFYFCDRKPAITGNDTERHNQEIIYHDTYRGNNGSDEPKVLYTIRCNTLQYDTILFCGQKFFPDCLNLEIPVCAG